MRRHLIVLAVVAAVLGPARGADARERLSHLRPLDGCATTVVADAFERSATVRDLDARLAKSDVVAYVTCTWPQAGQPEASLAWVSATPVFRFVRLHLSYSLSPWRRIEMLGHEMQHAVEVSEAPWVRNEGDLEQLFLRIGRRTSRLARFETAAAQGRERDVRRELTMPAVVQVRTRPT